MVTYADIQDAYERIRHLVVKTPLLTSDRLNDKLGYRLFVKAEMLQRIGAFKFRGACNAILSMSDTARPVIAYSSGNHAQAVALVARLTGHKATIIMPKDAPAAKIEGTRSYGAEVVLYNRYTESREDIGTALAAQSGAELIKPYDDERVIAGQGTIGIEIAEQIKDQNITPSALFCCAGGGGLISGASIALHNDYPELPIYGCEPADFDDIARSLATGVKQSNDPEARSICDAIVTPCPGDLTWPIMKDHLAGAFGITDEEALNAIQTAWRYLKIVAEPGGAVGLACALTIEERLGHSFQGKDVIAITTGGNVDDEMFIRALSQENAH